MVLSYCRILHTLETGEVVSKRTAGEWALDALGREWRKLIQRALDDRPDPWARVRRPADAQAVERTKAFMAYASALARSSGETRSAVR